jgi:hypothetical protein
VLVACDASTVAEPLRITAADVDDLNRASVERAAAIARLAGSLVVAAGAVGLLAWVWVSVRTQQNLGGFTLAFSDVASESDPDLAARIDGFVSSVGLLTSSALAVGVGLAVRLIADYAQTRVGGTVTGFVEGDEVPDDDEAS